jgi:probable F420-dependent oxidoreductase
MRFSLALSMCDPSHYLPLAQAAEKSGWDSVCVPDGGPWTASTSESYGTSTDTGDRWWGPETAFLDPFVVISAMAAVTERIHFLTNVYKLPARSPIHTASAVASARALAPGRIALGIGLGWNREEFEALGIDFESRGRRADEAIVILRKLLAGEWVEFEGEHFTLPRLKQSPSSAEPLTIYAGGDSPAAMRRAARLCDGWIARAPDVDEVSALVGKMKVALEREGRAIEDFPILAMCPDATDETALIRLREAGVDEVELWPWNRFGTGLDDLPGKCRAVERFAEEIIEPLRSRFERDEQA